MAKILNDCFWLFKELAEEHLLASQFNDHPVKGQFAGKRDCYLKSDLIMIYAIENNELVLYRTSSHADLFR